MFSPLCFAFCLGLYVCYRYCPLCLLCLYWFFFLLMFVFLSLLSMFLSFVFYNTNPFCVKSTPYVVFVWFHCIEIEILIWSQKKKAKKLTCTSSSPARTLVVVRTLPLSFLVKIPFIMSPSMVHDPYHTQACRQCFTTLSEVQFSDQWMKLTQGKWSV